MRDAIDVLTHSVGAKPSRQWLDAFRTFLHENGDNDTGDDSILFQILHSDLRDVVRPVMDNNVQQQCPSIRLRAAIKESQIKRQQAPPLVSSNQNVSNNGKSPPSSTFMVTTLDDSFRLMCQVEELLDVSLNSESRLAMGQQSSNDPTPVGNQQRLRCLKLCLSDGYDAQPIIAMEVSPIPNLAVNSKAGLKIVLSGPIQVRWGMLQCHAGNTLVLGGEVQELAEFQQKALAHAKQVAGVGIDPTIRALIGTTPLETEDDQDEGEGESGDVMAPPPTMFPPAPAPTIAPPMPTAPPLQSHRVMPPPPSRGGNITYPSMQPTPTWTNTTGPRFAPGAAPANAITPSRFSATTRPMSTTTNPYSTTAGLSSGPTPASALLRQNLTAAPATNPYNYSSASSGINEVSMSTQGSTNTYAGSSTFTTTTTNPYSRSSSCTPNNSSTSRTAQHLQVPTASNNPYSNHRATSNSTSTTNNPVILPTTSSFVKASALAAGAVSASNHLSARLPPSNSNTSSCRSSTTATIVLPIDTDAMMDLTDSRASTMSTPTSVTRNHVHGQSEMNQSNPSLSSSSWATPATMPPSMAIVPPASTTTPINNYNNNTTSAVTTLFTMEISDSHQQSVPSLSQNTATSVPDQKMSFENLRTLVQQLLGNAEMYKSYHELTFVVPLVQRGSSLGFDIGKRKDRKKKKGSKQNDNSSGQDKYEFVVLSQFTGFSGDGTITCKIESNLVEPFFGLPPGEMRKLSRIDRIKSNTLVQEGGNRVRNSLFTPGTWKVTLAQSPEELFPIGQNTAPPPIDGSTIPILLLHHKEGM